MFFKKYRARKRISKSLGIGEFFGQSKEIDGIRYEWLHAKWVEFPELPINPTWAINGCIYGWIKKDISSTEFIRNYYSLS